MSDQKPFDRLAGRFSRNIYDTPKGQLRLALLKEDLAPLRNGPPLQLLDAGGGLGQMSRWFAAAGHRVVLVDASAEMLEQAAEENRREALESQIELVQSDLQSYLEGAGRRFSLVLCHAVLEWVEQPLPLLQQLAATVAPGGRLSLMFFNRHSLVLRNLLRGNFRQVKRDDWRGDGNSLTPCSPLEPDTVYRQLEQLGVELEIDHGVRAVYDYLPLRVQRDYLFEDILEMERMHRGQMPYRQMARYIHLLGHFG